MAIRDWHVGQFIVFWVGAIALAWLSFALAEEVYAYFAWLFWLACGFGAAISALVVGWRWFGGRQKPPSTD